jgi:hypothetical protein
MGSATSRLVIENERGIAGGLVRLGGSEIHAAESCWLSARRRRRGRSTRGFASHGALTA